MRKALVAGIAVFGLVVGAAVAKADVAGPTDEGSRGGQLVDEGVSGRQWTDDEGARGGQFVLASVDGGVRGGQLVDEGVSGGQFIEDDGSRGGQNTDDDGARGGQRAPVVIG